ncbi:MAG TPA: hypothetical protein VIL78_00665 [Hanamia sp.]
MKSNESLNDLFVKHIDYASEEFVKTLLVKGNPSKELTVCNPFIGVVTYPSQDFLTPLLAYAKTQQFEDSTYVGFIEMLLPQLLAPVDSGLAFTLLEFTLDAKIRRFLQISEYATISQAEAFGDWLLSQYPGANDAIPFNRAGMHTLTDIQISGGVFIANAVGVPFLPSVAGSGAYTPAIEFEFAVSGFKCLLQ